MPHRDEFDCLWCGRHWQVRSIEDLEGWAQLCPDCLGRAGDNPFLRDRLKAALEERVGATRAAPAARTARPGTEQVAEAQPGNGATSLDDEMVAYYDARAAEYDDWYLRRGRYSRGPVHDSAWAAELDAAGRWLDALPIRGEIAELAAGTGWWSPLLAGKGELWAYDASPAALDRARERLMAHRLRAHLHLRDAWAPPDRRVDALFCGFWISHIARGRLDEFFRLARNWLRPGGTFAAIDSLRDPHSGAVDHPEPADDLATRRLADGRQFAIVKVFYTADELRAGLLRAGFVEADVSTTGRFFVLVVARA